jgi:hypothetical protein
MQQDSVEMLQRATTAGADDIDDLVRLGKISRHIRNGRHGG